MGRKMPQKRKAYIYVLNTSWVKLEFVKGRCCGGKWRIGSLKSGELEKKVKNAWTRCQIR